MALRRCKGRGVYGASVSHIVPRLSAEDTRRAKPRCPSDVDSKTSPLKQMAMESARSVFHAQLAAVMDSLLAAAVCEIAKIFEGSLCEQQAELAHKTDEICVLRGKLEKVERRQKATGGGEGSEEVEVSCGDRERSLRPDQTLAGSGCILKDSSSLSNRVDELSQSLSGLKEEATCQSDASIKREHAVPRPSPGFIAGQVPDGSLAAGDLRQTDNLSATEAKAKLSHWDQDGAEHRSLQDQASTPFLSISQSGRCSQRPDPSLAQPADWLPALNATRGGMTAMENLQMDGTSCSGPASSSAGTDGSCFRPGFVSDDTSNEDDDGSFPFLDQEPENHDSNQNAAQGHGRGLREARQVQPQAPSGESSCRPRDDRGGRGSLSHTRRLTSFGSRDPLRPQSNALRHTNALSHPAPPGGGSGRPYTCPYCSKCFTYPSHQRRHLLRHTGVRLHPCQFCDKSFLTPSELTVHTRTHTGERPFGCAQCGKRFARSGNLRAHQRDVHMGKRPFACGECGKRFAHRGNLRVHNHRVHQGDPYYMEDQQEPDIGPNPI